MRAAENTSYGEPQVLQMANRDRPVPGPRQILVEVEASAVTQGDRRLRAADFSGGLDWVGRLMFGVFGPRHPVGGTMVAGRIVSVGREVTRFAVGDDVFASIMHGAWAEHVAIDEKAAVATMPSNVTYQEAAALPYGGITALHFLRDMADVRPGERVLVVGAAGGVGRMAVQIAKHLGAEVAGVCSARDGELVRDLGASDVIDYRQESFTDRDEQWDVILDTVEGNHFRAFRGSLTPRGRYLSLYLTARLVFEMLTTRATAGPRAMGGAAMGGAEAMEDLAAIVERGALRPIIAARFPLEQVAAAHTHLETVHPSGDIVIEVKPHVRDLDKCA